MATEAPADGEMRAAAQCRWRLVIVCADVDAAAGPERAAASLLAGIMTWASVAGGVSSATGEEERGRFSRNGNARRCYELLVGPGPGGGARLAKTARECWRKWRRRCGDKSESTRPLDRRSCLQSPRRSLIVCVRASTGAGLFFFLVCCAVLESRVRIVYHSLPLPGAVP